VPRPIGLEAVDTNGRSGNAGAWGRTSAARPGIGTLIDGSSDGSTGISSIAQSTAVHTA
jgi:hypothetical protein